MCSWSMGGHLQVTTIHTTCVTIFLCMYVMYLLCRSSTKRTCGDWWVVMLVRRLRLLYAQDFWSFNWPQDPWRLVRDRIALNVGFADWLPYFVSQLPRSLRPLVRSCICFPTALPREQMLHTYIDRNCESPSQPNPICSEAFEAKEISASAFDQSQANRNMYLAIY